MFLRKTYNQKYTKFVTHFNFNYPFIPYLANSIPIQTWSIVRSIKKFTVDFGQISKTLIGSNKAINLMKDKLHIIMTYYKVLNQFDIIN